VQAAPADQGAAEFEQGFVDVVADLPADAQAAEPMQQGEALFDDPAPFAQTGSVFGAASAMTGVMPSSRTRARYLSWS
jgi:hypothetical protein